jgi:hypothetical protein
MVSRPVFIQNEGYFVIKILILSVLRINIVIIYREVKEIKLRCIAYNLSLWSCNRCHKCETLFPVRNFPLRMLHKIISWHFESVKRNPLLSNFIQWFRVRVGKAVPQAWQFLCVLSWPFRCFKPKLFQPLLYSSPICSLILERRGFETDVHLSDRILLTVMQRSPFLRRIIISIMPANYWLCLIAFWPGFEA